MMTRINTGTMLHIKNDRNDRLFKRWIKLYPEYTHQTYNDQNSFIKAFYESDVRFYPLSQIYNARTPFFTHLLGDVQMVHGRDPDMEKLRKIINVVSGNRCWDPVAYRCRYKRHLKRKAKAL